MRNCFWHFTFLLFMIVVMYLWRPSREARIYAFVKQIPSQTADIMGEVDFDKESEDTTAIFTPILHATNEDITVYTFFWIFYFLPSDEDIIFLFLSIPFLYNVLANATLIFCPPKL